jgi:hypothetical protein
MDIRSTQPAVRLTSLSLLLMENGLPDLPVALIEPHRNHGGMWRIIQDRRNIGKVLLVP